MIFFWQAGNHHRYQTGKKPKRLLEMWWRLIARNIGAIRVGVEEKGYHLIGYWVTDQQLKYQTAFFSTFFALRWHTTRRKGVSLSGGDQDPVMTQFTCHMTLRMPYAHSSFLAPCSQDQSTRHAVIIVLGAQVGGIWGNSLSSWDGESDLTCHVFTEWGLGWQSWNYRKHAVFYYGKKMLRWSNKRL